MIAGEEFFTKGMQEIKALQQNLSADGFDNVVDYAFRKAHLEGELQAYQSSLVEYRKFVKDSGDEEATIMMHIYCKNASDKNRMELGKTEKLENQEDETITADRGRFNGFINGYIVVRNHFDALTSEFAADRQRAKMRK